MQIENRPASLNKSGMSLTAPEASGEEALFYEIEAARISVLKQMQRIADYDQADGPLISQAVTELRQPTRDPLTYLKVAKAYVSALDPELSYLFSNLKAAREPQQNHPGHLPAADQSSASWELIKQMSKENIVRWILMECLETAPALFEGYAEALQTYLQKFTAFLNYLKKMQERQRMDEVLWPLAQGQMLASPTKLMKRALLRLVEGRPVVFLLHAFVGMGDVLLMMPIIYQLAQTFAFLEIQSPIHVTVNQQLAPIVTHLSGPEKALNIHVMDASMDEQILIERILTLASPDCADQSTQEHIDPADLSAAQRRGGLVLFVFFNNFIDKLIRQSRARSILFGDVNFLVAAADDTEHPQVYAANFRHAALRSLSYFLGLKAYDNSTRDDLHWYAERMQRFLHSYCAQNLAWQREIRAINTCPGFEGGYICVVGQGSKASKSLTSSVFLIILDELQELCQQKRLGMLIMRDHTETGTEALLPLAQDRAVPCREMFVQEEDVAYSLAFLQQAMGVIGPDTFLTHAAEYIPHMPVLNLLSDSNSRIFRINNDVIPVEHALAKGTERECEWASYQESYLYMQNYFHPFTIFTTEEERATVHPLLALVQDAFLQRLRQGLAAFRERLDA